MTLPESTTSYRKVNDGIVDYYCAEFGVSPTETYPQDLISLTRVHGVPHIVIHQEDHDPPIIIQARKDVSIVGVERSDSDIEWYTRLIGKDLRLITNVIACGYTLSDDDTTILMCVLGTTAVIMQEFHQKNMPLPVPEQDHVNISIRVVHLMYPTFLYVAVRLVAGCTHVFLYLDKDKPGLPN